MADLNDKDRIRYWVGRVWTDEQTGGQGDFCTHPPKSLIVGDIHVITQYIFWYLQRNNLH